MLLRGSKKCFTNFITAQLHSSVEVIMPFNTASFSSKKLQNLLYTLTPVQRPIRTLGTAFCFCFFFPLFHIHVACPAREVNSPNRAVASFLVKAINNKLKFRGSNFVENYSQYCWSKPRLIWACRPKNRAQDHIFPLLSNSSPSRLMQRSLGRWSVRISSYTD